MEYNEIELHFYGTKQVAPDENSSMCIIQTDDIDTLHNAFETGLKTSFGHIPRNGFPKITKIRDLSNELYANQYALLYDLVYSKEDYKIANNMLPKLLSVKEQFNELDRAKLLLIALEIQAGLAIKFDKSEIEQLISENKADSDWIKIKDKLNEIFHF